MSDPFDKEKQEEPLDPAVERVRMKLRRLLMGSTLIMVLGLGAVFSAIIYKLSESDDEGTQFQVPQLVTDADLRRASFPLPQGARIVSTSLSDTNLAVTYEMPQGGGAVLLIDVASWQVFSVMELAANKATD